MSLAIQKSDYFITDFELRFDWYVREAGWGVATAYLDSVDQTLNILANQPGLGRVRRFKHARLRGIRSFRVKPRFNKHLIFYRYDASTLYAERIIHGARDLPRRLLESPGAEA